MKDNVTVTDRLTPNPRRCEWPTHDGRCHNNAVAAYELTNESGNVITDVGLCEDHATTRSTIRRVFLRTLNRAEVTITTVTLTDDLIGDFDVYRAVCACGATGPLRRTYREASQDGWTHVPPVESIVDAYGA